MKHVTCEDECRLFCVNKWASTDLLNGSYVRTLVRFMVKSSHNAYGTENKN
jgi:hypothetical protein